MRWVDEEQNFLEQNVQNEAVVDITKTSPSK